MATVKKDLETQLLGGEEATKRVSLQALEAADEMDVGDEGLLFFNEDGTMGRNSQTTRKLEGKEAMAFLNLPPRDYNRLKKGDLSRIRLKFGDFFERLIKENKGAKRTEDALFWNQIRVRVINKSNVGKMTRECASAGIQSVPYNGDIFSGDAIKNFLPETKYSNAADQYILQLLSIVVTEELENV